MTFITARKQRYDYH